MSILASAAAHLEDLASRMAEAHVQAQDVPPMEGLGAPKWCEFEPYILNSLSHLIWEDG